MNLITKKELRKTLEEVFEKATWTIRKFANDEDYKNNKPYEVSKIDGNILVNEGINEVFKLICGTGGAQFSSANANLIVGTGTGDEAATDTEATFTNGVKKGMDSGFPTYGTNQKATWKATYDGSSANQAWNEFGVLNAASSGKLLNRKVSSQGTKTSGQVWEISIEISLS
mgnify:CR=1 FL=1